jgi:hypothetical protein
VQVSRYHLGAALILVYVPTLFVVLALWGLAAALLVLLVFGASSLALRCPKCGTPLFQRVPFWMPWPSKFCRCGRDLRS